MTEQEIENAIEKIQQAKKYRDLSRHTIRDVLEQEMDQHASWKQVLLMTKKRLHKVLATHLGEPDYKLAHTDLEEAFANPEARTLQQEVCRQILIQHSYTRDRLAILPELYQSIFEVTGEPVVLCDLASALNPFSFPWMNLSRRITYCAYDINLQMLDLVNFYFQLQGLQPLAQERDILCTPPQVQADVSFLFKMYHWLEMRQPGGGWKVIEQTPTRWMVVSFPVPTFVTRHSNYLQMHMPEIRSRAEQRGWPLQTLEFINEFVLVLDKAG